MKIDELKIKDYVEILYDKPCFPIPWKDSKKLMAIDEECFSTLEINEKNEIVAEKIVDFPNTMNWESYGTVLKEMNILYATNYTTYYFYDLNTGKKTTLTPIISRKVDCKYCMPLDNGNKIILLQYCGYTIETCFFIIYDLKNDKYIYNAWNDDEGNLCEDIIVNVLEPGIAIRRELERNERMHVINIGVKKFYAYDFIKKTKVENNLANYLTKMNSYPAYIFLEQKICLLKGFPNILTWENPDYKNIKINPLFTANIENSDYTHDYELLSGHTYNYGWIILKICKFDYGINGETLYQLAFLKVDSPVRIPVVIDEYWKKIPNLFFIEHPVYGVCCLIREKKDNKKYYRIYKMNDVEKIIQEYMSKQVQNLM